MTFICIMANSNICLSFILLFSFLLFSLLLASELPQTSLVYVIVIKADQHHEDIKVFKEPNPTSSYDLERKRRGGSSMPSSSHFVRHGYTTPLEEPGKGTLSKDIADVDKVGLENGKWYIDVGFGDGDKRGSNGIGGGRGRPNSGMGSSNGQGDIYRGSGGRSNGGGGGGGGDGYPWVNDIWGDDYLYEYYDYFPEPMNYKDASIMKHENMKKLSDFDRGSFREYQAKIFGMKNGEELAINTEEPKSKFKRLGLIFGGKDILLRKAISNDQINDEEKSILQSLSSFFESKSSLFSKKLTKSRCPSPEKPRFLIIDWTQFRQIPSSPYLFMFLFAN
ncbi:hypothetical protein Lal_00048722 [Lupinus albus]|nr:hypothetical protein Lal_00048722 [Lupinus albus]